MKLVKFTISAVVAACCAAAFVTSPETAAAVGGNAGSLGNGGIAKGDISMEASETDTIDVELVAGEQADVTFTSAFAANFTLNAPSGDEVALGFAPGSKALRLKGFTVPETGTFRFTISSNDGSQGGYTLVVKPKWAGKIPVSGTGQQTIEFPMPAGGRVSAVITRAKGAPGQPQILSLTGPGGELAGVIDPVKNSVKLAPVEAPNSGTYGLTVTSTDGTSAWQGIVTRTAPKAPATKLDLVNGINQISFRDAGLDEIFQRRCGSCHFWGNGYTGVRAYATKSLAKIRSGDMPPDGRLSGDQVALIQSWISTGRAR